MKKVFLIIVLFFAFSGIPVFNLPQAQARKISCVSDFLKARKCEPQTVSVARFDSSNDDGNFSNRIFEMRGFVSALQKSSDYG